MSILNVNKINPVGGGSTITIAGIASVTNNISVGNSVTASSFHGNLTGTATGLYGTANISVGTITVNAGSNTTQAIFSGNGGSGSRGLSIVTESVGATDEGVILNARASGTTGRIKLQTNSTTALTIDGSSSNGNITANTGNIIIGTGGKGIDFSAQTATSVTGASTTAEILDHYEEGSWTPVFINVNTPTYTTQYGIFTRVGRMVLLHGQISVSSIDTSDGSTVNIGGFPFVGNSSAETCLFTFGRYTNLLPEAKLDDFTNARFGGTFVMLHEGNNADISYAELNSSGTIQFSVSYMMS